MTAPATPECREVRDSRVCQRPDGVHHVTRERRQRLGFGQHSGHCQRIQARVSPRSSSSSTARSSARTRLPRTRGRGTPAVAAPGSHTSRCEPTTASEVAPRMRSRDGRVRRNAAMASALAPDTSAAAKSTDDGGAGLLGVHGPVRFILAHEDSGLARTSRLSARLSTGAADPCEQRRHALAERQRKLDVRRACEVRCLFGRVRAPYRRARTRSTGSTTAATPRTRQPVRARSSLHVSQGGATPGQKHVALQYERHTHGDRPVVPKEPEQAAGSGGSQGQRQVEALLRQAAGFRRTSATTGTYSAQLQAPSEGSLARYGGAERSQCAERCA